MQLREQLLERNGKVYMDQFDDELRAGKFGLPPFEPAQIGETLYANPSFFVLRNVEQIYMVQEILLDVNYRTTSDVLRASPIHSYVTLSRDGWHFWSSIFLELASVPPVFSALHACFEEFKQQLLAVVDDNRKQWIDGSINLPSEGSWYGTARVLNEVMAVISRVQMPVRDKGTADGWKNELSNMESPYSVVKAVRFIHKCIRDIEHDTHSMKIMLVSRNLSENGVAYVRGKFHRMLGSGIITMDRTKVCG
jgi:hypothetical protein